MSTETSQISRQIAMLPWRSRLGLLWKILQSFLPSPNKLSTPQALPHLTEPSLSNALSELQGICREENYTLEVLTRHNRANPFSNE